MAPKKKAKTENGFKVTESGEEQEDSKADAADVTNAENAVPVASQQAVGDGGPEAPKLDLTGLEVFEYAPGKAFEGFAVGTLVRCEIEAKYLTTENLGIKERKIWGSDPYTDDTDLVAMAQHAAIYTPTSDVPKFHGLVLVVRILGKHDLFAAANRNGIKSRSLTGVEHSGLSLSLEGSAMCKTPEDRQKLKHVILRPSRLERFSIKGHNAFAEARVIFNLANEPAFKYSLSMIADRSPDAKNWTSVRLKNQVLYMETTSARRFELSLESQEEGKPVTYKLAEVPKPRTTTKSMLVEKTIPLPSNEVELQESGLQWGEVKWGTSSLQVRGNAYKITCIFWLPVTPKGEAAE